LWILTVDKCGSNVIKLQDICTLSKKTIDIEQLFCYHKTMTRKWNIDPFDGYNGNLTWLPERTIFVTVHGSQAYGTNVPESDVDVKGLCVPPKQYFLGYMHNFEQAEGKDPYDMVIYGLRKFFKLAADCNPNIIEVLNTDPEDWVITSPLFEKLWEKRDLFLSRKARFTFSGYAMAQLKRIKSHKKWLLDPPTHKPTREEYLLPAGQKISQSDLGATAKLIEAGTPLDVKVMELFRREQNYHAAARAWSQYQGWKANRNEKRATLEAQFGYDTKHAMHLVRLMTMCREILTEGSKVVVRRPDADMLRDVRSGGWDYDRLIAWAEAQEAEMAELYEASPLPPKPRTRELDALCQELVEEALSTDNLR
jgi:predicted nucleotidyltransferase